MNGEEEKLIVKLNLPRFDKNIVWGKLGQLCCKIFVRGNQQKNIFLEFISTFCDVFRILKKNSLEV